MLTSAYTRKDLQKAKKGEPPETNVGRLFAIFAWMVEFLHSSLDTMRLWNDIDTVEGKVLDRFGANVGVAREGTNDAIYRIMIRIKIIAQLSGGDINTVIRSTASLFNIEPSDVFFEEIFPAKIRVTVPLEKLSEEHLQIVAVIGRALKRLVAAGIGYDLLIEKPGEIEIPCFGGIFLTMEKNFELTPQLPIRPEQELNVNFYASPLIGYYSKSYEIEVLNNE